MTSSFFLTTIQFTKLYSNITLYTYNISSYSKKCNNIVTAIIACPAKHLRAISRSNELIILN